MKLSQLTLVSIVFLLLISSCSTYTQDEFIEQYVIETFLISGEPFPAIRLSKTVPFNQSYIFDNAAISNARVRVMLQAFDGGVEQEFEFIQSDSPGVYIPTDEHALVLPGRRYHLRIDQLENPSEEIKATTFVPGKLTAINTNADTLTYQGNLQFELTFDQGFYPGRQNVFVASSLALEPDNYPLTPFWAGQDSDEDEFIRVSSGLINEGNYNLNVDGSLTLKYPWIGIAYFGPNELTVFAVDSNIYDYLRSVTIQGGGSTLSPGQIENVLWNIDGGIGIFGSKSGISNVVFVKSND